MIGVRDFVPTDAAAVRALLEQAFPTKGEADLVERLRADDDSAIELIAIRERDVVGHILFSRLEAPCRALALAPVAVDTAFRRQGIAAALIEEGHARARAAGYDMIFVLGDPRYYDRFGYATATAEPFSSPYSGPHFMALELHDRVAGRSGGVGHASAFSALG